MLLLIASIAAWCCCCCFCVTGVSARIPTPVPPPTDEFLARAPNDGTGLEAHSRSDYKKRMTAYSRWIHDALPEVDFDLRAESGGNRPGLWGVYARRDLESDVPFLRVPEHLMMQFRSVCKDDSVPTHLTQHRAHITPRLCALLEFVRSDRKRRYDAHFVLDACPYERTQIEIMLASIIVAHIKFAVTEKRAVDPELLSRWGPYVDTFHNTAPQPMCAFNALDLRYFALSRAVLRMRRAVYAEFAYLQSGTAERRDLFDAVFPNGTLTYQRYAWARCHVMARAQGCPGSSSIGLVPVFDQINNDRSLGRSVQELTGKATADKGYKEFATLALPHAVASGKEILHSVFFGSRDMPHEFIEHGTIEPREKFHCGAVLMPLPNETLFNPCISHFCTRHDVVGLLPGKSEDRVAHEACFRPRRLDEYVDFIENTALYNKSCTEWHVNHGRYVRRTALTRFHAVQFLSLMMRAQLRLANAKLAQMDALARRHATARKAAAAAAKAKAKAEGAADKKQTAIESATASDGVVAVEVVADAEASIATGSGAPSSEDGATDSAGTRGDAAPQASSVPGADEGVMNATGDGGAAPPELPPHLATLLMWTQLQQRTLARMQGRLSTMQAELRAKIESK